MLHVVTAADQRFLQQARHLKHSLSLSNPDARLTIYCHSQRAFADLASAHCAVVEIPDMAALGAKRSKFTAFRRAIKSGSFVYLDADAIVLEPLVELTRNDALSGCPDDLLQCPFITDKSHPWPNAPELVNNVYINSGVLFVPASREPFIEEIYEQSRFDLVWNKYIFPGKLFDNHFLCAALNLQQEPVTFLDQQVYGWQGFWNGSIQAERRGDQLVNKANGKVLKIVVFAGLQQSYDLLLSLPAEIASLLFERILPAGGDPDQTLGQYLAAASPNLAKARDPHTLRILQHTLAEMRHLVTHANSGNGRTSRSYFADPDAMRAFACAQPSSESEWNGLKCGGAYLEGEEYRSIRAMVRELNIQTVLETGAGETSILFSNLGVRAVSVESTPGPWLDRARAHDCLVLEVPFDEEQCVFAADQLRAKLQDVGLQKVDLLFIDSPVGTASRRNLLTEFAEILPIRYVLYHDAIRDAANIFQDQQTFGLRPVTFVNSVRGLALFENLGATVALANKVRDFRPDPMRVRIDLCETQLQNVAPGDDLNLQIEIENVGTDTISSHAEHPVFASYHWLSRDGSVVVFDGIRTSLPFDIESGDSCRCWVNVISPDEPGRYELQVSLVQEQVCWFHDHNPECRASLAVEVSAAAEQGFTITSKRQAEEADAAGKIPSIGATA